ncbi:hypothetical protein EOM82_00895 [bacterium]|nr:hypothetical protein [bacterium]
MESAEKYALNKAKYAEKGLEYYTPKEERWNTVSHFIGGVLGFLGMIYLIIIANTTPRIIAAIVTGIGGSIPYFVSAAYHFIRDHDRKLIARKIDYSAVSFIIVACGAPLTLGVRLDVFTIVAIVLCFILAIINIILSIYDIKKYSRYVLVADLIVSAIFFVVYLYNRQLIPISGKIFYACGAAFCLAGLAFFGRKKQFLHACFHILMVFGTVSFFFANVFLYFS